MRGSLGLLCGGREASQEAAEETQVRRWRPAGVEALGWAGRSDIGQF